jgi:hypothetical protein
MGFLLAGLGVMWQLPDLPSKFQIIAPAWAAKALMPKRSLQTQNTV